MAQVSSEHSTWTWQCVMSCPSPPWGGLQAGLALQQGELAPNSVAGVLPGFILVGDPSLLLRDGRGETRLSVSWLWCHSALRPLVLPARPLCREALCQGTTAFPGWRLWPSLCSHDLRFQSGCPQPPILSPVVIGCKVS